ncbi:MAG TPA: hypothetical protein VGK73_25575 [Polyangiaceae bacterium]
MKVLIAGSGRHLLPEEKTTPTVAPGPGSARPPAAGGPAAATPPAALQPADVDTLLKEIRGAAHELGKALAAADHEIWVGSDEKLDVDPSVVAGALSVQAGSGTSATVIRVKVPRGLPEPYAAEQRVRTEWAEFPDWDVTTLEVIDKVDAVVLLGGRKGVIHAGTAAWMMRKVVIPIGTFGGGAETVGRYGSSRRAQFYRGVLSDEEIDRLHSPWGKVLDAKFVVDSMQKIFEKVVEERMDTGLLRWTSWLAFTALILWVVGLVLPSVAPSVSKLEPWPAAWSFPLLFPTVIAAGTFGACVKTLRNIRLGTRTSRSSANAEAMLGVAAGIIVAILYLLAQIGVSGEIKLDLEPKDYTRVSIVVSMAALFAGMYLDKALSYLDGVGDSVIRGEHGKAKS